MNIREPVWHSGSHSFLSPRVLWHSNFVHLSRVLDRLRVSGSQISLICPVHRNNIIMYHNYLTNTRFESLKLNTCYRLIDNGSIKLWSKEEQLYQ